jgi:4-diphosphocytidyl-2-C-methyl-D-erythritol kinase
MLCDCFVTGREKNRKTFGEKSRKEKNCKEEEMKQIQLQSNAKINLSLDILGREEAEGPFQGYHFVQTIMHEVTPQNTHGFQPDGLTIAVEKSKKTEITIVCDDPNVPTDETNTAYQAAEKILTKANPVKVTITIKKNIPVAQGLGGGSSNAAETLKGLNQLLGLGLKTSELQLLAAEVGMDVPFFINGGVALAEHYGEQITQLPPVNGLAFTLFTTDGYQPEKTIQAYKNLDLSKCGKNTAQTEELFHAIKTNDHFSIHATLHNDFATMLKNPLPENHHLTGAGPAHFLVV